jgi:hypothetical protein
MPITLLAHCLLQAIELVFESSTRRNRGSLEAGRGSP